MARVLIDGYNLLLRAGHDGGLASRDALERLATRYRAGRGVDVVVVFDSRTGAGSEPPRAHGVRVLFAAGEADRAILDMVAASAAPRDELVVTSDRRLAEQARDLGARAELTEAFLERAARRAPPRRRRPEAGPRLSAAEVDDWLRYFQGPRPHDDEEDPAAS